MGNLCSVEGAIDHWIYVKTGDRKDAGTDANIKVILYDVKGTKSPEISLTCRFRNDFERGQTDTFQCPPLGNVADINVLELWKDGSGVLPDWYCEVIMVNDARREKCFYFPVHKWIRSDRHYMIKVGDTSLPQYDPYLDQRNLEIEEKKRLYQYSQQAPDLPVQVRFHNPIAKGAWPVLTRGNSPAAIWKNVFDHHGFNWTFLSSYLVVFQGVGIVAFMGQSYPL